MIEQKDEIIKMFKQRDEFFSRATKRILNSLPIPLFEGIYQFLNLEEGSKVVWEDVGLVESKDTTKDPLVVLIGAVTYTPGSIAHLQNGQDVQITEEMAGYFQRVMRIGVPVGLVSTGTTTDIVKFLQQTVRIEDDESIEDLATIPAEPKVIPVHQQKEFDLAALTEEQRDKLAVSLSSLQPSGKKN